MTANAAPDFDELPVPLALGSTFFHPGIEQVRKFAGAVEDPAGWRVGDPSDGLVHPLFLATYVWFPSGFLRRAPGEAGHFELFRERYPHLVELAFLHAKTSARFHRPFALDRPVRADVALVAKDRRRGRDFIVMRGAFFDADGHALAAFDHACAIRGNGAPRTDARPTAPRSSAAPDTAEPGPALPSRRIEMTLDKSRRFSLPGENHHTDDRRAQALGARVAIPAATMSFAYLSRLAQDQFGEEAWISRGRLDATFTRMVQRDDVLEVGGHRRGNVLDLRIINGHDETVAVAAASLF
jgi:acyl dehydratase